MPAIVNGVAKLPHVVPVGQPVFDGGLQIFAHRVAPLTVTHVRPAAHGTVAEHVAPCAAVPAARQSAILYCVLMNVDVNRSQVQPAGHSGFDAAAGSQFDEHVVAPGIAIPLAVIWMTHWPRGARQSALVAQ